MKLLTPCFLMMAWCWSGSPAFAQTPEAGHPPSPWKSVEKILGRPGVEQGGLVQFDFPRTDLNVTVNGIPLEPGLALTSWFLFKPLGGARGGSLGKGVVVRGKLVLLDQEVSKVTVQLKKRAFKVSEVFSPLLNESPAIKCFYIEGQGSRTILAQALDYILAFTGTPLRPLPSQSLRETGDIGGTSLKIRESSALAATQTPSQDQGWSEIQKVLGPGKLEGKVLVYEFPLPETKVVSEFEVPPFMGMASTLHFQKVRGMAIGKRGPLGLSIGSKVSKEVVAAAGHFLVTEAESGAFLEILGENHIQATVPQSVPFDKSSNYHFLYFWAQGTPEDLAAGLKAVLVKTNQPK